MDTATSSSTTETPKQSLEERLGTITMSKTRLLKLMAQIPQRLTETFARVKFVTISRQGKKAVLRENIDGAGTALQAIQDLLEWRDIVKTKVLISNAKQTITIEGLGTHTVAFWIEKKKDLVNVEGRLLKTLRSQFNNCKNTAEKEQALNESKLTRLLEQQFSGQGTSSGAAQNSIVNTFWDQWKVSLVDKHKVKDLIGVLEDKFAIAKSEIDTALQEHNAQCSISVPNPKLILL